MSYYRRPGHTYIYMQGRTRESEVAVTAVLKCFATQWLKKLQAFN